MSSSLVGLSHALFLELLPKSHCQLNGYGNLSAPRPEKLQGALPIDLTFFVIF